MTKQEALAKHLECSVKDVELSTYDDKTFIAEGEEYLVLLDNEADEIVKERIENEVCFFNADFIAAHTHESITEDVIKAVQEKYEEGNEALIHLITDFDRFVQDAVNSDGRGHFLNHYDGNEFEVGEYFIYQV